MKSKTQIYLENKIRKMVREELLSEENTYIEDELTKISVAKGATINVQFVDSSGNKTKYLGVNHQSVPKIINWLKSIHDFV